MGKTRCGEWDAVVLDLNRALPASKWISLLSSSQGITGHVPKTKKMVTVTQEGRLARRHLKVRLVLMVDGTGMMHVHLATSNGGILRNRWRLSASCSTQEHAAAKQSGRSALAWNQAHPMTGGRVESGGSPQRAELAQSGATAAECLTVALHAQLSRRA